MCPTIPRLTTHILLPGWQILPAALRTKRRLARYAQKSQGVRSSSMHLICNTRASSKRRRYVSSASTLLLSRCLSCCKSHSLLRHACQLSAYITAEVLIQCFLQLRFRHKEHGAWILELARYDTFSPNVVTASSKSHWGASFWNTEWDGILGTNDNLSIGQAATWEPKFEKFFPGIKVANELDKDGFQSFLDDIKSISGVLDRMRSMPKDQ